MFTVGVESVLMVGCVPLQVKSENGTEDGEDDEGDEGEDGEEGQPRRKRRRENTGNPATGLEGLLLGVSFMCESVLPPADTCRRPLVFAAPCTHRRSHPQSHQFMPRTTSKRTLYHVS